MHRTYRCRVYVECCHVVQCVRFVSDFVLWLCVDLQEVSGLWLWWSQTEYGQLSLAAFVEAKDKLVELGALHLEKIEVVALVR